jgi:hypothetical protein
MDAMRKTIREVNDAKDFLEKLELLSPEKREHMRIVVKGLIECYLRDDVRALVVLSEDDNPFGELMTINCNEMEALGMLQKVSEVMLDVATKDAPPKEMMN